MKIQNSKLIRRLSGPVILAAVLVLMPGIGSAQTLVSFNAAQMSGLDSFYSTGNTSTYGYQDIGNANGSPAEIIRPVLSFDLSSIPSGATINSATLVIDFTGNALGPATQTINVNELTTAWTTTGVTWNTTNGTTPWTTLGGGGDFISTPSSSLTSAFPGHYPDATYYSFTGLASDVQGWVNTPGSNNGWILINADESSGSPVAKQVGTWTEPNGFVPVLDVTYTAAPEPGSVALLGLGMAFMAVRFLRGSGNKEVS